MATQAENRERVTQAGLLFLRLRYPWAAETALLQPQGAQVPVVNAWRAWVGLVFAEMATKLNAVDAGLNEAEWDAVQIDEAALVASDPGLDLKDLIRL
jgi:hypothetical protein